MNRIVFPACVAAALAVGVAFGRITSKTPKMEKVTGIGGVFFKCKDPQKTKEWYEKHLGLPMSPYGSSFEWRPLNEPNKKATTQWAPFKEATKYFGEGPQTFMINYRVKNLEALIKELQQEGVTIVDKMETVEYGKFVHILDVDGNRVELWEAVDEALEKG